MQNFISSSLLHSYQNLVKDQLSIHANAQHLFNHSHLNLDNKQQLGGKLSFQNAAYLIENTAFQLDCPDFGLRLSRYQGIDFLGPIAVVAKNSPSTELALKSITHYLMQFTPSIHIQMLKGQQSTWIFYQITDITFPHAQLEELALGNILEIIYSLQVDKTPPLHVQFRHHQLGADKAYQQRFHCPVRFNREIAGIEISNQILNTPIEHADPLTCQLISQYLDSLTQDQHESIQDQVLKILRNELTQGIPSLEQVAQRLYLHPRSLQRRLQKLGTSFEALKDTARQEQAWHYLKQTQLSVGQISHLLGYSDQSALTRACIRWFKLSPLALRKQH